jgi:glutathione S-transferase
MLTLYQYPGADGIRSVSPPCLKIEMALRLLGVEHEVKNIFSPQEGKRVSLTGRLPVLEIDGERIPDSVAILDRLETAYPDAPLWPTDPKKRLQDRLWDHYVNDSLYWLGFYLRWVRPDTSESFFQALFRRRPGWRRLLIRLAYVPRQKSRAMLQGVGGKPPELVHRQVERALDTILEGLDGGSYLQGRDRPGRGDLACASFLVQPGFRDTLPETMQQIRERPALGEHCRRVLDACSMEHPRWFREAGA